MRKEIYSLTCICAIVYISTACNNNSNNKVPSSADTSLINTAHLDYLYTPVTFPTGTKAAGIYIYAEAPDYHVVGDADEGFTCVDDVARAAQVYLRSGQFSSDTSTQSKAFNLIKFVLEMQSENGYFYNFIFPGNTINKIGVTSKNIASWWSWRALYTLTEGSPFVRPKNPQLADKMNMAVNKLAATIKKDIANDAKKTKTVNGITIPQWLPAGSGTDQAALLIIGLIPYCKATNDTVLKSFIKKMADGIVMMQQGDATHFPYGAFLSWENTWHAYACDQAYALLKAGDFFNDSNYISKALIEVNNFYPWLLKNGMRSSFLIEKNKSGIQMLSEKKFDQIAYGIRPMISAAAEAYRLTGDGKYANIAGHLAAWFFGINNANKQMYSSTTGRCFDGIKSETIVNLNSGAESTIEALLAMQIIEQYPAIIKALNNYKK